MVNFNDTALRDLPVEIDALYPLRTFKESVTVISFMDSRLTGKELPFNVQTHHAGDSYDLFEDFPNVHTGVLSRANGGCERDCANREF